MTADDVLEAFAKLPLPLRMRAAADVLDVVTERSYPKSHSLPRTTHTWAPLALRELANAWEAEAAKHREHIVDVFSRFLASNVGTWPDDEWDLRTKPNYYIDKAGLILDRYPHIAEGWPTE